MKRNIQQPGSVVVMLTKDTPDWRRNILEPYCDIMLRIGPGQSEVLKDRFQILPGRIVQNKWFSAKEARLAGFLMGLGQSTTDIADFRELAVMIGLLTRMTLKIKESIQKRNNHKGKKK